MDFLKRTAKGAGIGLAYGVGILASAMLIGAGVVIGIRAGEDINSAMMNQYGYIKAAYTLGQGTHQTHTPEAGGVQQKGQL